MKAQTGKEQTLATDHPTSLGGGQKKHLENPRPQKFAFMEEIHHRADTMTPVLKEILDFRPPPH
jgi:hypothetical protein